MTTTLEQARVNANGDIAVRYYQSSRALITKTPSGKEYVAVTQANICLAWIDPDDVENILARKGGCCGKKRQLFSLASEDDVRRWTNRGGR